jgi:serine protease DegS
MEQIIAHGRPLRGWLGFEAQALTPDLTEALGLQKGIAGLVITTLYRNGPAHKAGVQPGDALVAIDGKKTDDPREVLLAISGHKPGEKIRLDVVRDGKPLVIVATAGERPGNLAGRLR